MWTRTRSVTMAKTICRGQHKKKINRSRRNDDKDRKALYKLMNNVVYFKTLKNLRDGIDVKLVSNNKDYLKCTSKPNYMSKKYLTMI